MNKAYWFSSEYQCSTEFRLFAKKSNVTVYLNAHGVTEAMRRTHPKGHDYENLTIPLRLGDVEGGGKWSNTSINIGVCNSVSITVI